MTKPIDGQLGLTAERLRSCIRYEPNSGIFIWLVKNSARRMPGEIAGECKPSGYVLIGLDGHRYRAHRLAWLYMTGEWPSCEVDHRNGVRDDNRWENLRLATQQQNQANAPPPEEQYVRFQRGILE